MKDNEISESLFEKADDGDKEALKEVIAYYKSIDDEENAIFYQMKLNELSDAVQENKIKDNTFKYDYQEELDAYLNGEYDHLTITELRANEKKNPYYYHILATKYYDKDQYIEAFEYCQKELKLLESAKNLDKDSLFNCLYFATKCIKEAPVSDVIETDHYEDYIFIYASNALEIDIDNKKLITYIPYLYSVIAFCYEEAVGCDKDLEKAAYFQTLADSFTIAGSLKRSVIYHNQKQYVEEEEWLEKAVVASKDDNYQKLAGNEAIYHHALKLKLALIKDEEIDILEYKDVINKCRACFNNEELAKLDVLLAKKDTNKCFDSICAYISNKDYLKAQELIQILPSTNDYLKDGRNQEMVTFVTSIMDEDDDLRIKEALKMQNIASNESIKELAINHLFNAIKCNLKLNEENKKALFKMIEKDLSNHDYYSFIKNYCLSINANELSTNTLNEIAREVFKYDKNNFDEWAKEVASYNSAIKEATKIIKNENKTIINNKSSNMQLDKDLVSNKLSSGLKDFYQNYVYKAFDSVTKIIMLLGLLICAYFMIELILYIQLLVLARIVFFITLCSNICSLYLGYFRLMFI